MCTYGSAVWSEACTDVLGDESTDFLLSLTVIDDLLKFMCSELALFTDQVVGSIDSGQVLVGEEKSDTVELVKFAVGAHSEATADTFGILEVRKELVNEEVELADKDSAFLFIAGFVAHQGKKFFQSSHLGRVLGGFGEALDDLLTLIANVGELLEFLWSLVGLQGILLQGKGTRDTQNRQKKNGLHPIKLRNQKYKQSYERNRKSSDTRTTTSRK